MKQQQIKFCHNCGKKIPLDAGFCPMCGAEQKELPEEEVIEQGPVVEEPTPPPPPDNESNDSEGGGSSVNSPEPPNPPTTPSDTNTQITQIFALVLSVVALICLISSAVKILKGGGLALAFTDAMTLGVVSGVLSLLSLVLYFMSDYKNDTKNTAMGDLAEKISVFCLFIIIAFIIIIKVNPDILNPFSRIFK